MLGLRKHPRRQYCRRPPRPHHQQCESQTRQLFESMNALVGTTGSRRLPVEILAEHEVKALIRANSTRAPTGVRNRAPVATLYRSGLRISEALALELRDLDPDAGNVERAPRQGRPPADRRNGRRRVRAARARSRAARTRRRPFRRSAGGRPCRGAVRCSTSRCLGRGRVARVRALLRSAVLSGTRWPPAHGYAPRLARASSSPGSAP